MTCLNQRRSKEAIGAFVDIVSFANSAGEDDTKFRLKVFYVHSLFADLWLLMGTYLIGVWAAARVLLFLLIILSVAGLIGGRSKSSLLIQAVPIYGIIVCESLVFIMFISSTYLALREVGMGIFLFLSGLLISGAVWRIAASVNLVKQSSM
ncbi:MAG: hypothetical protein EPN75_11405 [Beijerinckiaceae bacterium]|nr:MAG: hypothetical protein EPN75_11405 [Beijerinckiaceae bacterium]